MFTIEQLKQLSDFLIHEFKEVFVTKEDLKVLEIKISNLRSTMDGIVKITAKHEDEIPIMGSRLENVEGWVKEAAPKIGLEYKV